MPLIFLSCAWIAGIFLGEQYNLPLALTFTGLAPLTLLFFFRQHKKIIILGSLSLIIFFAAVTYSYASLNMDDENKLLSLIHI